VGLGRVRLLNAGGRILLKNAGGQLMHRVDYTRAETTKEGWWVKF
jgi:hypothetical protein